MALCSAISKKSNSNVEAMSKLCIHESNVDLLLATPPYNRIVTLLGNLIKALANKSEPVIANSPV
jgi:hypothetical protein